MRIVKTKNLSETQLQQINRLWDEEYPEKLKGRFGMLLDGVENYNHYHIEDENGNIRGWAVDFEKDNEIRFSIIIAEKHKGNGLGSMLIEKLKEENNEFYGWVIDHSNDKKLNGENYYSPLPFYIKHGFEVLRDMRIDSNLLNAVKIKWERS